jgi:hypothetical protein
MNNIKIKLKTSELTGAALDWAVARCELGEAINEIDDPHFYSTDWAQAGPIIERWLDATVERFRDAVGGQRHDTDQDIAAKRPNAFDSRNALLCGKPTGG